MKLLLSVVLLVLAVRISSCRKPDAFNRSREGQPTSSSLRLDDRIPPADRTKYREVRDGSNWKNPFLVIGGDGIEIRYEGGSWRLVSTAALARSLVTLPVTAWPYGRVVAASENGVRGIGDTEPIERNKKEAEKVLRELGLEIDWWPSA